MDGFGFSGAPGPAAPDALRPSVRAILRSLCRVYPLKSGCGAIANLAPMQWAARSLPAPSRARLRDGSIAIVDPRDALGRALYYVGDWDPKIRWVCGRLLRAGDTFVDIGAHCGVVTLPAARIVGASGRVHAFEPNPWLAELLRTSARENGYAQLHTHEYGLSDADGEADLHLSLGDTFYGSLTRRRDVPGTTVPVQLRHASRFLASLALDDIRLMKIDVEGHEEIVLAALGASFEQVRPDAIVIETDDFSKPYWERGSVRAMRALGFRMIGIPKSAVRVRLVALAPGEPPAQEFHDSIGVAPAAYDEVCARLGVGPRVARTIAGPTN